VHDVAEIPEAVPVLLLDLLLVKRDRALELFLDRLFERGRLVGQAPDAEARTECRYCGVATSTGSSRPSRASFTVPPASGRPRLGNNVSSLVRATPTGVLSPGCTSSYTAIKPVARVS
jgi:hypothetical protein